MFRAEVEAIAARFGLNPARLARLIRSADVVVAMGESGPIRPAELRAAARDREPDVPERDAAAPSSQADDRSPGDETRPGGDVP